MDTGVQLGRRFRALKLWMVMRHFGAEGLRSRTRRAHSARAGRSQRWVAEHPDFDRRGARAVQRRVLPRQRIATNSTNACSIASTRAARCSSRTRASTDGTSSGWPSATSARPKSHVARAGPSSSSTHTSLRRPAESVPAGKPLALLADDAATERDRPRIVERQEKICASCVLRVSDIAWFLRGAAEGGVGRLALHTVRRHELGRRGELRQRRRFRGRIREASGLRRVARLHGRRASFGFEVDFGWSPNFFENTTGEATSSSATAT